MACLSRKVKVKQLLFPLEPADDRHGAEILEIFVSPTKGFDRNLEESVFYCLLSESDDLRLFRTGKT